MPFIKGDPKSLEYARRGGRPAGVLSPKTIAKIKTKQAMEEEIRKRAGILVDDLFVQSHNLYKTEASKELLERAFGKVPQGVNLQSMTFSLKELAEYREKLKIEDKKTI